MFLEEKNLLDWIELIENQKLYEAVKNLSIEDQIFISYIVKEGRTQREVARIYGINQRTAGRKPEKILSLLKTFLLIRQKIKNLKKIRLKKHLKRLFIYVEGQFCISPFEL